MAVANGATLHHTAILVHDIEKSAESLAKALSVTWNIFSIAPENCFVNGVSSPFTFKVAFAQVGDGAFELISPDTGNSVYNEFLKTHGEGYHHTCFAYGSLEDMQSAKAELQKQGYNMIQHGSTEGVFEFCYFELTAPKCLLELLFIKEMPAPDKTIG